MKRKYFKKALDVIDDYSEDALLAFTKDFHKTSEDYDEGYLNRVIKELSKKREDPVDIVNLCIIWADADFGDWNKVSEKLDEAWMQD